MYTLEDRCFIANEIKNKLKSIYKLDFSKDYIREICYMANEYLDEQVNEGSAENNHGELINKLISDLDKGVNKFESVHLTVSPHKSLKPKI